MTPAEIIGRALDDANKRCRKEDDVFLDHIRARCAKAIARYLKEAVNLQRPIDSLSANEMHGMAEAATAEWIKAVSERIQEVKIIGDNELPSQLDEYYAMLMAG